MEELGLLKEPFRQHFLKEACFSFCKGIANYDAVSTMHFYLTDLLGSGVNFQSRVQK